MTTWNEYGQCSKHGLEKNEFGQCWDCSLGIPAADIEPKCLHLVSGTCLRCESRPPYQAWKARRNAYKAAVDAAMRDVPDPRYTVGLEFTGAPWGPRWVVRIMGDWMGSYDTRRAAVDAAWNEYERRQKILSGA